MSFIGYYQRPTIHGDRIVFMFEDDLWLRELATSSSHAYRLTANPGRASDPQLSPDGSQLAYTSLDEGSPEVYVTGIEAMDPQRLTYLGDDTRCVGWSRSGDDILFTTPAGAPFDRVYQLAAVKATGGPCRSLKLGPAAHLSYAPIRGQVLGRHTWDPARWKRYRGGTAGQLWIDTEETGHFTPLIQLDGNLTRPLWVGTRIYFGSDHEGVCNMYSCTPEGRDLQRHTDHDTFYIRYPNTDGKRLVYQCGGDIYLLEPGKDAPEKIDITVHTPRPKLARKFVSPSRFLESYTLSPTGSHTACGVRGKPFTFAHWEGPVDQLGERDGIRYRLLRWGPQGIICICDISGEEEVGLFDQGESKDYRSLTHGHDIGRVLDIGVSPCGEKLWLTNHRHELFVLSFPKAQTSDDLKKVRKSTKAAPTLAASKKSKPLKHELSPPTPVLILVTTDSYRRIESASWSPDGQWLAYPQAINRQDSQIMLWGWDERQAYPVTSEPFYDWAPDFDPDGRYLYFLSCRDFDPVRDNVFFEYSFPKGARPYLITLQKEQPDPFVDRPRPPGEDAQPLPSPYIEEEGTSSAKAPEASESVASKKKGQGSIKADLSSQNKDLKTTDKPSEDTKSQELKKIRVDLDGIERRIRVFPVDEGRYFGVMGLKGKVLLGLTPVQPSLRLATTDDEAPSGTLGFYDLKKLEANFPLRGVSSFDVSLDRSTIIYRSGSSLRALKAANLSQVTSERTVGRTHGWIDLARLKVSVKPLPEWNQMLKEAWRLMRDNFWDPAMSKVDWAEILKRYQPLLDRLSTRREFSDLLWEFQGELGTSHAYEYGGDYSLGPQYSQGKLAATLRWIDEDQAYVITEIADGDAWSETTTSPLALLERPLKPGDLITAVGGHRLTQTDPPEKFLVNQAEQRITLTILRKASHSPIKEPEKAKGKSKKHKKILAPPIKEEEVVVRTLRRETPIRYRAWVEANRRVTHERSGGKLGYIHIPNMSATGYAEFHRGYYSEVERDGLIIDVRYNGGGNVSALLLEKLARRRLGFDVQRWGKPIPYPQESPAGPLIALTNEQAGSDGDIFSHCFKLMGLGPLLGKRTWGGTIGIWPRHNLVDNTVTTQPEFAFWFNDVGWGVENYGTDPDEEVEIRPQDWHEGVDTQLERAITAGLEQLEKNPPLPLSDPGKRPDRRWSPLPQPRRTTTA